MPALKAPPPAADSKLAEVEDVTGLPDIVLGDFHAQLSAVMRGRTLMQELVGRHGRKLVADCMRELQDYSERMLRQTITGLPSFGGVRLVMQAYGYHQGAGTGQETMLTNPVQLFLLTGA